MKNSDETRRAPHCTKCGDPVKGHSGPHGSSCMNEAGATESMGATGGTPENGPEYMEKEDTLSLLVTQMTKMNINLEAMIHGQTDILNKIDQNIQTRTILEPPHTDGTTPRDISARSRDIGVRPRDMGARPRDVGATSSRMTGTVPPGIANGVSSPPVAIGQDPVESDRHVTQAMQGEFVNLCDFLSSGELISGEMESIVVNGVITFRPKRSRKFIDSFSIWSKAWNAYERILMMRHADKYEKFVAYRELIQNVDVKYQWHAVSSYDMRFRANLAKTKSFDYDILDTTLFTTIFDATAVKSTARSCLRCKSFEHFVKNCPFPAETLREAPDKSQKTRERRKTQEQWFANGIEGCNRFQTGNCNYSKCARAHVCRQCKGPEPLHQCKHCA